MRMLTAAAVVAATVATGLVAGPAAAADPIGKCRLVYTDGTQLGTVQDVHEALIDAVVTTAAPEPVTVVCDLLVDGTVVASRNGSGVGGVAFVEPVTFAAGPLSTVQLCTKVMTPSGVTAHCDPAGPGTALDVGSAVVGFIRITKTASAPPSFVALGVLSDPTRWTCSDNFPALPYAVTCTPLPTTVITWTCDVLHADVQTIGSGGVARTSMDCDGGGAEVTTNVVSGPTGFDSQHATSAVAVNHFVCTVDAGPGVPATGEYRAGCGDPGAPRVSAG